jgi:uncharacterized protein (TIGR03437 family)
MTVVSGQNCTRTVTSNASWITITFGATGTGNGSFGYSVDPNTGATSRTGTITAAGQTFTVDQDAPSVTLNPTSASFPATGGTGTFTVSSAASNWIAQLSVSWIQITANPNGFPGTTTVSYSVAANPTPQARDGSIQVGAGAVSVHQAGLACTATINPTTATVAASGVTGSFTVTSLTPGCTLSALPSVPWITAFTGSSNTITYNVSANATTLPRTGAIAVADKTFTITQAGQTPACTFALSRDSAFYPAIGGNDTVGVTASAGCAWTAASNSDWLKIISAGGPGNGVVAYSVSANTTTASRSGALTIAGLTLSISQAAPDPAAVLLSAVKNAASYQGGAVAPGEFVVLGGSNIGPPAYTFQAVAGNRFGTMTANTQVLFDGVPAALYYVGATQSVAIVPYSIYGKSQTQVQVQYQGVKSNPLTLDVTDAAPGIFTQLQNGLGAASVLNQDFSLNTAAIPAPRGSIISVYATGEGQTDPGGADGLIASGSTLPKPLLNVTATVGGVPASVQYAGAAPTLVAGVLQVNVTIPDSALSGNAVLVIQVGTKSSQAGVTVAIQ